MSSKKLKTGERFYHSDLNKLILCRDEYFNHVYDKETAEKHQNNDIKYYTVDNSGKFHTTNYKFNNNWKEFIVVNSKFGGGGTIGKYDLYPDAWEVYCKPINVDNVLIKFHQLTNCFTHKIDEVTLIL